MTIIQKYIAKHIIMATFLVFVIVTALGFIVGLLRELHDIGGDYTLWQALVHNVLLLPYTIYQFFPMMILLGGVLGLSMLAGNHELIVMRSSGFSIIKITWSVISAAFILIIIATLFGELLAPRTNYWADVQKSIVKSHGQAVSTKLGVWIHEGNNFLHVRQVVGLQHLEGVTRYEFDKEHHLLASYFAKTIDFENGRWLLHDLVKTTFHEDKVESKSYPLATWNLTLTPNLLNVGLIEPEAMSLSKLAEYTHYLVQNRLQANSFRLVFWQRIFQPLSTLVMILLAIPFVFSAPRSVTLGLRVLLAIMIGFIFYIVNALVGQFSIVYQFPPLFAALLPAILFSLFGYSWLLRIKS